MIPLIYVYDFSFLIIFSLIIGIFLYRKRKKLVREGPMFLYKTSIGLKFIDYFGKKYPRIMKVLSYIIVACGYALMVASVYFLIQILMMFTNADIVRAVKVPPVMPLIPYLGEIFQANWLPPFYFTYWIIAIALVAIFHEGAHGVFARFNRIKIKSTGFGFLGPFLAFFVEQDDNQMKKAKIFPQLTVLGAGVFANLILTVIFFLLMGAFFNASYVPTGVAFSDYSYSLAPAYLLTNATLINGNFAIEGVNFTEINFQGYDYFIKPGVYGNKTLLGDNETPVKLYHDSPAIRMAIRGYISEINGNKIRSNKDINIQLVGKRPGEYINLTTNFKDDALHYILQLGSAYDNESRAVMGVIPYQDNQLSSHSIRAFIAKFINQFQDPSVHYEARYNPELARFVYYLLWWIFMINLSVAIANMIPLGIFDGGRFFMLTILAITRREKVAEKTFKYVGWLIIILVAAMMALYFSGIF